MWTNLPAHLTGNWVSVSKMSVIFVFRSRKRLKIPKTHGTMSWLYLYQRNLGASGFSKLTVGKWPIVWHVMEVWVMTFGTVEPYKVFLMLLKPSKTATVMTCSKTPYVFWWRNKQKQLSFFLRKWGWVTAPEWDDESNSVRNTLYSCLHRIKSEIPSWCISEGFSGSHPPSKPARF